MKVRLFDVLACVLLILVLSGSGLVAFAETQSVAAAPLTSQIDYRFVGHLERFDDDGRLLVWEATIDGSVKGNMKWWFASPPPVAGAEYDGVSLSFYSARWEIWSEDELLLAGESAGKTVFPTGADGVWDGHGIVTEARADFAALKGRRIYETGPVVVGSNPPVSYLGSGMFVIY
jgi:hypothetical protein